MELGTGEEKKQSINYWEINTEIAIRSVRICLLDSRQIAKKSGAKVHLYVNAGLIIFICRLVGKPRRRDRQRAPASGCGVCVWSAALPGRLCLIPALAKRTNSTQS